MIRIRGTANRDDARPNTARGKSRRSNHPAGEDGRGIGVAAAAARWALVAAAIVGAAPVAGRSMPAVAAPTSQSAATACVVPETGGSAATPQGQAQPEPGRSSASPAADQGTADEAEAAPPRTVVIAPRSEPTATGVDQAATRTPSPTARPSPSPVATTAEPDPSAILTTELTAVAEALAACLTAGRAPLVATLATDNYLGQLYGGGLPLPREEYLALAEGLDPVPTRIRSLRDARRDDDEATAEVVSIVGNQLLRSRWRFVLAPRAERDAGRTAWRVDGEELLPFDPPADATIINATLAEYTIELDTAEVAGPSLLLRGQNSGAEDHELLVLRLDDGATTGDLLRGSGPSLPTGVTYVGQITVPSAGEAELVLVDLEPGDYAVVCLFPTPRGTPHLALGMGAALEVT